MSAKLKSVVGVVVESLAVFGLALQAWLILGFWNLLPVLIPVHFNLQGEVTAHGDKSDLLLLFGLSLVTYLGLTWLGHYPQKFNYPWQITRRNAAQQYRLARVFVRIIKCEIVALFTIIAFQTVGIALGWTGEDFSYFFVALIMGVTGLTAIGYMAIASRPGLAA